MKNSNEKNRFVPPHPARHFAPEPRFGNLGDRIRELFPGMNFHQIHESLEDGGFEVQYESVRRYCGGDRRPDFEFLVKLSRLKNVSVDWLLTGESIAEPSFDTRDSEFWEQFSTVEAAALREFAMQRSQTIAAAAHWLVRDSLYRHENLRNEKTFEFFSLSEASQTTEIALMGSIRDNEYYKPTPQAPPVRIPLEAQPADQRGKNVHEVFCHAYLIETQDFASLGIMPGHMIIAGNRSLTGAYSRQEGNPILLRSGAGSRLLLRRFHFDFINGKYYVFIPLTGLGKAERHPDTDGNDIDTIFAVVTP